MVLCLVHIQTFLLCQFGSCFCAVGLVAGVHPLNQWGTRFDTCNGLSWGCCVSFLSNNLALCHNGIPCELELHKYRCIVTYRENIALR